VELSRENRRGSELVVNVQELEEYINTTYILPLQQQYTELLQTRQEVIDLLDLYKQLNDSNGQLVNSIRDSSTVTTNTNNQIAAEDALFDLNTTLTELSNTISFMDSITLLNLYNKQNLYSSNKVDKVEGSFTTLQVETVIADNDAANVLYFNKRTAEILQPPQPLQPLKYLVTDDRGNLLWR
jgi:hypothetical protein